MQTLVLKGTLNSLSIRCISRFFYVPLCVQGWDGAMLKKRVCKLVSVIVVYILVCVNIFILRSYHNNYRRPNVNNNYGRRANSMIPLEVQPRRD